MNATSATRKVPLHLIAEAVAVRSANNLETDPRTREIEPDPSSPPASKQLTSEAVDDDTYDEDQGGFVIDTAGVFCAVISDQHSDLYIDKDDLMPELVSDDDTDSEEESPPYRSMTELPILPAILHAFDPKQLSYEAVSAELDRYLGGPQPIIVYSTHTPQWSDTGDAQYSDLLQQFISSQQERIGDHLPEHITIDPDLSEDQNEERWWTHHWGLV